MILNSADFISWLLRYKSQLRYNIDIFSWWLRYKGQIQYRHLFDKFCTIIAPKNRTYILTTFVENWAFLSKFKVKWPKKSHLRQMVLHITKMLLTNALPRVSSYLDFLSILSRAVSLSSFSDKAGEATTGFLRLKSLNFHSFFNKNS